MPRTAKSLTQTTILPPSRRAAAAVVRSCWLVVVGLLLLLAPVAAKVDSSIDEENYVVATVATMTSRPPQSLCVIGCTPYVDPRNPRNGINKYHALIADMAASCDIMVHVGDTKPGRMACNTTLMVQPVLDLVAAGARHNRVVLYAPGDNELNDCHRHASHSQTRVASQWLRATDARQVLVDELDLQASRRDLTGQHVLTATHDATETINPATCDANNQECESLHCEFDKYMEMDDFAVATLEVIGSHWYLDDERGGNYPFQDEVDPLAGRLPLYINAKDCAVAWVHETARRASESNKTALFFMLHASFYAQNGRVALGNGGLGQYYGGNNLVDLTRPWGDPIRRPYQPLFDAFTQVGLAYPDLVFQIVHSDAHRYFVGRLNPTLHNHRHQRTTNHNVLLHQVEGASRALTMYTRFTVDRGSFQPISIKQEWSRPAYDADPPGHAWIPY